MAIRYRHQVTMLQSKGLYNLASSEQPVNADWQKASLKMRFISEVNSLYICRP